ncbi:uncharacterized protein LOC131874678 isoform X1 [Cryptomeria japonica]|uniref:uncharacterized protein LOC131874678 isoform X1 n=1 Tax=Cryptomeria japonica TaxID=3369 RepID=UPI0027D9CECC|nr:uncharacterized protein LOC131874678 isoform X1 [Cryptomeria japonica]
MKKSEEHIEKKALGCCSTVLACLPSKALTSSATANPAKGKSNEAASDADNELEGEGFDFYATLTNHIENFLNQARDQDEKWSDQLGSVAAGMFTSAGWINSLSTSSKNAYEKLTRKVKLRIRINGLLNARVSSVLPLMLLGQME